VLTLALPQIMPLFKRHNTPPPPPPPPEPERHGLFGRKKTPPQTAPAYDHRGQPMADDGVRRSTSSGGGLFHRNHSPPRENMAMGAGAGAAGAGGRLNDASISNARQRVAQAETAERQADQALMASRAAVKEAREHVRILEREVEEE
jgi:hypothetical protein